jgi:hypothetical protein
MLSPLNVPYLRSALSELTVVTVNEVYCTLYMPNVNLTANFMTVELPGGNGSSGYGIGFYTASGTALARVSLLGSAVTGVPLSFSISATAIVAGTTYYGCYAGQDSAGSPHAVVDNTTSASMYNQNGALDFVTAANAATGTGASFALPATLGTITAASHVGVWIGLKP